MNYAEVKAAALAFANRSDDAVVNNIDVFIKLAEARVNRLLKVRNQSAKGTIAVVAGQKDYDLPADFRGMRTLRIKDADGGMRTVNYVTPEDYVTKSQENLDGSSVFYCVLGNKLAIIPALDDVTLNFEMFYYQKVPNLNATDDTNWLSVEYSDVYIYGIQAQIAHFTKNSALRDELNTILGSFVDEIRTTDFDERWGGPPMTQTLG